MIPFWPEPGWYHEHWESAAPLLCSAAAAAQHQSHWRGRWRHVRLLLRAILVQLFRPQRVDLDGWLP